MKFKKLPLSLVTASATLISSYALASDIDPPIVLHRVSSEVNFDIAEVEPSPYRFAIKTNERYIMMRNDDLSFETFSHEDFEKNYVESGRNTIHTVLPTDGAYSRTAQASYPATNFSMSMRSTQSDTLNTISMSSSCNKRVYSTYSSNSCSGNSSSTGANVEGIKFVLTPSNSSYVHTTYYNEDHHQYPDSVYAYYYSYDYMYSNVNFYGVTYTLDTGYNYGGTVNGYGLGSTFRNNAGSRTMTVDFYMQSKKDGDFEGGIICGKTKANRFLLTSNRGTENGHDVNKGGYLEKSSGVSVFSGSCYVIANSPDAVNNQNYVKVRLNNYNSSSAMDRAKANKYKVDFAFNKRGRVSAFVTSSARDSELYYNTSDRKYYTLPSFNSGEVVIDYYDSIFQYIENLNQDDL